MSEAPYMTKVLTGQAGIAGRGGLLDGEELIQGPFNLFDDSMILEFWSAAAPRDASVVMRTMWKHQHPLCRKGKGHPFSPPLHLHFEQDETFKVASGSIGYIAGWDAKDRLAKVGDEQHTVKRNVPHCFWPDPNATEDTVIVLWAHPNAAKGAMDHVFFNNLLGYLSDTYESKTNPSALQMCILQHWTETALVMLPTYSFLGPLRWSIPWAFQGTLAAAAHQLGYRGLMPKYTTAEQMAEFENGKGV